MKVYYIEKAETIDCWMNKCKDYFSLTLACICFTAGDHSKNTNKYR